MVSVPMFVRYVAAKSFILVRWVFGGGSQGIGILSVRVYGTPCILDCEAWVCGWCVARPYTPASFFG